MNHGMSNWRESRLSRSGPPHSRTPYASETAVFPPCAAADIVDTSGAAGPKAASQHRARRVLMLSFYFPPSNLAGVFRSLRFVKYLPAHGWQPLVVAAQLERKAGGCDTGLLEEIPYQTVIRRTPTSYPDESIQRCLAWITKGLWPTDAASSEPVEANRNRAKEGNGSALRLRSAWSPVAWGRNAWDMALLTPDQHIWWQRPASRAARELLGLYRPQIIFSTGPPHSTHVIASRIKRRAGLPWVMDMRDPWSTKPWGYKARNPWGQRLHPAFESKCIRHADCVLLNTQRMYDDFVSRYPAEPRTKFRVLTNGYDPSLATKVAEHATQPREAGNEHRLLLCHPGSLYGQRDPRPLIAALELLRNEGKDAHLEQIGGCADHFGLEALIGERHLEQAVTLRKRVPHDTLLRRMAAADVLLVVQPQTAIQVPAKLFEMLLFHKPIVALTGDGETADIVQSRGLGQVARPDSARAIANAIRAAAAMRPIDDGAWQRAIADFDGQRLTGILADVMDQLCPSTG